MNVSNYTQCGISDERMRCAYILGRVCHRRQCDPCFRVAPHLMRGNQAEKQRSGMRWTADIPWGLNKVVYFNRRVVLDRSKQSIRKHVVFCMLRITISAFVWMETHQRSIVGTPSHMRNGPNALHTCRLFMLVFLCVWYNGIHHLLYRLLWSTFLLIIYLYFCARHIRIW